MAYTATAEDIQKIRYELNDNEPGLYLLDDATITYYLEKNEGSISIASIECARAILLRLSMNSVDESVDVLSIKNSKAAEQYRLALEMYLKNPQLNPIMQGITAWIGNVSKAEMQANSEDCDNNIPKLGSERLEPSCFTPSSDPFSV